MTDMSRFAEHLRSARQRGWTLGLRPGECEEIAKRPDLWRARGLPEHALRRIRSAAEKNQRFGGGVGGFGSYGARLSFAEVGELAAQWLKIARVPDAEPAAEEASS